MKTMNRTTKTRLIVLAVVVLFLCVVMLDKPTVLFTRITAKYNTVIKSDTKGLPSKILTTLKPETKENNKIYLRPSDFPEFFIPRSSIVNPMNFVEVTKPNTVQCDSKNPPFLTVLALTMHANVAYRDAIRQTWGSEAKVVFLMGSNKIKSLNAKVLEESVRTKDIVMFDVQESYFNLTYKVLMGFKWVNENCNGTKFVMKVDEDTFVNIKEIYEKLKSPRWNERICGPYFTNEHCQRQGKYKVLISSYPFEFYPPHVKGNMYLMPKDIAIKLLKVSYYMPYCNMEDAYITGVLAMAVGGIKFQNILGTYYNPSGAFKRCRFIKSQKLVSQGFNPPDFKELWDLLKNNTACYAPKAPSGGWLGGR